MHSFWAAPTRWSHRVETPCRGWHWLGRVEGEAPPEGDCRPARRPARARPACRMEPLPICGQTTVDWPWGGNSSAKGRPGLAGQAERTAQQVPQGFPRAPCWQGLQQPLTSSGETQGSSRPRPAPSPP